MAFVHSRFIKTLKKKTFQEKCSERLEKPFINKNMTTTRRESTQVMNTEVAVLLWGCDTNVCLIIQDRTRERLELFMKHHHCLIKTKINY